MHDNTNIRLPEPSDPDLYRALRLEYYDMCCAKGGIALQQCGWIRNIPLCTGAISDQGYLKETEVLKQQRKFAEMDTSSQEPGLNVLDKGYRSTLAAKIEGQRCLQPDFAECDKKFKPSYTLHSACVAVIRSGNERAVNVVKRSWFIKHGAAFHTYDLALVDDVWLAWGFQVNFMYNPVH